MRLAKLIGGAGLLVAAALVGGTLIGSALAVPSGTASSTDPDANRPFITNDGEYCEVFRETFAAELGVSVDDLLPATKAAALAAVDAAVEAGDLDEERAAALRERIDAMDEAGCGMGWAFGHGMAQGLAIGHTRGLMHADVLDAAADALGLDSAELIEKLQDDTSLEEIAADQKVSYDEVKAAVIGAVQDDLDAAVAKGLDQEHADAMLERVQAWLDEGGELGFGTLSGERGHQGGPWH